MTDELGVT